MNFGWGAVIRDIDKNRFNYMRKTKIWARTEGETYLGTVNKSFGERKVWQEREKWQQLQEYKFILKEDMSLIFIMRNMAASEE